MFKTADFLQRFMLRHAFRHVAILAGLTLVGACGTDPIGPSPAAFQPTVRVVSALAPQVLRTGYLGSEPFILTRGAIWLSDEVNY